MQKVVEQEEKEKEAPPLPPLCSEECRAEVLVRVIERKRRRGKRGDSWWSDAHRIVASVSSFEPKWIELRAS